MEKNENGKSGYMKNGNYYIYRDGKEVRVPLISPKEYNIKSKINDKYLDWMKVGDPDKEAKRIYDLINISRIRDKYAFDIFPDLIPSSIMLSKSSILFRLSVLYLPR